MGSNYRKGIIDMDANNNSKKTNASNTAAQKAKEQETEMIEYARNYIMNKLTDNTEIVEKLSRLTPERQDEFFKAIYPTIITIETQLTVAVTKQADIALNKQNLAIKQQQCHHVFTGEAVFRPRKGVYERTCSLCKFVEQSIKDPNAVESPQRTRDTRISRRNNKPNK